MPDTPLILTWCSLLAFFAAGGLYWVFHHGLTLSIWELKDRVEKLEKGHQHQQSAKKTKKEGKG